MFSMKFENLRNGDDNKKSGEEKEPAKNRFEITDEELDDLYSGNDNSDMYKR